jgi:hypothetical protein
VNVEWAFALGGGAGGAGPTVNLYRAPASAPISSLFDAGNRIAGGLAASGFRDAGLPDGQGQRYGVRPVLPGGGEGAGTIANGGAAVVPGPFDPPAVGTPGAWPRLMLNPRPYDRSTSVPTYPTDLLNPAGSGPQVLVNRVDPQGVPRAAIWLGAKLN